MEKYGTAMQEVVLVDLHDRSVGSIVKTEAHEQGLLHRAVSVFLFNSHGEWMLQRRASSKYHSGGLWSNACCTHPRPGESPAEAAARRLPEELGISCPLIHLFCFVYRAELDQRFTEYEYDHIFAGCTGALPLLNPQEVAEWGYFPGSLLENDLKTHPESYTVWFRQLFPKVLKYQSSFPWNASD